MCCDSPSAPTPDPAIGQAAAANAEIGRESLDFSKKVYEEGKPRQAAIDNLVNQVVAKQLELQGKSADQADDYYNYMKSTFRPMEQSLADEANNFDTDAKRNELATAAGADVEQAAAMSDASAARDMARYGINPSDGAFADQMASSSINKTAAKVGAMNTARTQARAEGRAFKFDVAGLGRNLPSAGATSTGLALNAGNNAVGNAGAGANNARADAGTMLAGMGTSASANASAGNLYGNIFNGQMQGYNAQMASDSASSAGIGSLAGIALYKGLPAAGFLSSKKAKDKRGDVDERKIVQAVKGINIDKWRYKKGASNDQADHVGPYAEDFKKKLGVGDGKTVNIVDAIGVTLAAVKGLAKDVDRIGRSVASIARKGVAHA